MTPALTGRAVAITALACTAAFAAGGGVQGYGAVALGLLLAKAAGTWLLAPRSHKQTAPGGSRRKVGVIVPGYNEDPALWAACLRSIAGQTHRPAVVVVVDDGSTLVDLAALAELERGLYDVAGVPLRIISFPENRGKREALVAGFDTVGDVDLFLPVDSDTVLDPNCVAQLAAVFDDQRITAATAMVGASNRRGPLARMLDVRYSTAFAVDRGWQSVFGAMLCCCGSAAAYRADVIRPHLDEFLHQRFLGRRCTYGDDRRLTALALRHGRSVLVPGAHATTAVPERFGHWVRQQVRWNRSWARETMLLIVEQSPTRPAFWLGALEASTWVVFSAMLAVSLTRIGAGDHTFWSLAVVIVLVSAARSAAYFDRTDLSRRDILVGVALAPLYGIVHLVVVAVPIRLWAACTLREQGWGTRARIEVTGRV